MTQTEEQFRYQGLMITWDQLSPEIQDLYKGVAERRLRKSGARVLNDMRVDAFRNAALDVMAAMEGIQ